LDQLASRLIEFVSHQDNPLGLSILALSAFVEYIFPPFPGDTVTLFGAFLITSEGWGFTSVFASVLLGSGAGAMADFWLGKWLKRRELAHPSESKTRKRVDALVEKFRRHGEVFIVLNRFLPGVRAFFFVAAGMAGMRARWVFLWSLVSAALWNLLLIALGSSVGANFEELKAFFAAYSRLVWIALGLVVLFFVVRAVVRRLMRRPEKPT
jgi:membrane protein DedA with SNARE-associated domain